MLPEKCKLSYLLVVRNIIKEASEFQKVQIKGKSTLKTDVYNNNSFDLAGFNSILWFGSMCETYRIHYFFISM